YYAMQAAQAQYEDNETLMDMAFGMAEGEDLHAVLARVLRQNKHINREGVAMAAPDLLAPDDTPPQLVLTRSKAADKYMEQAAYSRFLRLIDVYDASLMHAVEKLGTDDGDRARRYYEPRKDVLDAARRTLAFEVRCLDELHPEIKTIKPVQDYEPL